MQRIKLQSYTVQSREAAQHRRFDPDSFDRGVVFLRAFFVAPPERHETGITLQYWNRATKYVEMVLVQGRLAEI